MSNQEVEWRRESDAITLPRRVILDESLHVWIGACGLSELAPFLELGGPLPRNGRRIVVLSLPEETSTKPVLGRLRQVGGSADRWVVVAPLSPVSPTHGLANVPADNDGAPRVLFEPDLRRAIIGSMLWLRAGDQFWILGPRELEDSTLHAAIWLGSRWRGAWEEPEYGEFHPDPR
jgi:hypothetical protein